MTEKISFYDYLKIKADASESGEEPAMDEEPLLENAFPLHKNLRDASEGELAPLFDILSPMADTVPKELEERMANFFGDTGLLPEQCIKGLAPWLKAHEAGNRELWEKFFLFILYHSHSLPVIQAVLLMMEAFPMENLPAVRQAILMLSRSPALTNFCLRAIKGWTSRNDLIFEMAKQFSYDDWKDRQELLQVLIPDTEEKKRWLLDHESLISSGTGNALQIARKIDFDHLLKQENLSHELYAELLSLLISIINDSDDTDLTTEEEDRWALALALQSQKQELDLDDYDYLYFIMNLYEGEEDEPARKIYDLYHQILYSPRVEYLLKEVDWNMSNGFGYPGITEDYLDMADDLGLNVQEISFAQYKRHPAENFVFLPYSLGEDKAVNEEVVKYFEKLLPLGELAAADKVTLKNWYNLNKLRSIAWVLSYAPGFGVSLLLAALRCPDIRTVEVALKTITTWQKVGCPIPPKLAEADCKAQEKRFSRNEMERARFENVKNTPNKKKKGKRKTTILPFEKDRF